LPLTRDDWYGVSAEAEEVFPGFSAAADRGGLHPGLFSGGPSGT